MSPAAMAREVEHLADRIAHAVPYQCVFESPDWSTHRTGPGRLILQPPAGGLVLLSSSYGAALEAGSALLPSITRLFTWQPVGIYSPTGKGRVEVTLVKPGTVLVWRCLKLPATRLRPMSAAVSG